MNSTNFFLVSFFLIVSLSLFAQQEVTFNWAHDYGGDNEMHLEKLDVDSLENMYLTGYYRGDSVNIHTSDNPFYFVPITTNYTNVFIKKQDKNGNLLWARHLTSTNYSEGRGITVDANGDVYITGGFRGTMDLNTDTGATQMVTAAGSNYDIFIIKLDGNGNFIWGKTLGATSDDIGYAVQTNANNDVYISGRFTGTVDFDPDSIGTFPISQSGTSAFWLKLDSNANFIWAKMVSSATIYDMKVGSDGNIYTAGFFSATTDFDPDTSSTIHTATAQSPNGFVHKFDSNGNFEWVAVVSSLGYNIVRGIALDSNNNVYSIGSYKGLADFDPGAGVVTFPTNGYWFATFLWKLTTNGQLADIRTFQSTQSSVFGYSIYINNNGEIYSCGTSSGTVDFGNGVSVYNPEVGFVHKMNNQDVTQKVDLLGNISPYRLIANEEGDIYTFGDFTGTRDFDPFEGVYNLSADNAQSVFVQVLRPLIPNDAGIINANVPDPCNTTQPVITLKNFGSDTLYSVNINSSLNGQLLPGIIYTTPLAPSDTVSITLAPYTFLPISENTFSFWTSQPNNIVDSFPNNDTTHYSFTKGMAGNYTIGGVSPDYITINDAVNDLEKYGVCGATVFDIRDGIYNELITIKNIQGTSANNTITFKAQSADSSKVTLTHYVNPTFSEVVYIENTDWLRFKDLTFKSDTSSLNSIFGHLIRIKNTNHSKFENCLFEGIDTVSTSHGFALFCIYTNNNNNLIQNCHFKNGSFGISSIGTVPNNTLYLNNTVKNNFFEFPNFCGIDLKAEDNIKISNNTILFDADADNHSIGIELNSGGNNILVTNNKIINVKQIGITSNKDNYLVPSTRGLFANNYVFVNATWNSTWAASGVGISVIHDYIDVVHNTVIVKGAFQQGSYVVRLAGDSIVAKNNLFVAEYPLIMLLPSTTLSTLTCDYNVYYNNGFFPAFINMDFATWQSTTGLDSNSLFINPQFSLPTHPYLFMNDTINDFAVYLPYIQTDINGVSRGAVRDVGAFEFDVMSSLDTLCFGDILLFDNQPIIVDSSGLYITITNTNDNQKDTLHYIDVTMNPVVTTNIIDTICQGESYNFHGNLLTSSGIYQDTLSTMTTCDSIVILTLTVQQTLTTNIIDTICQGESYNFHGNLLTSSGIYQDTLSSMTTCDSIVILTLTVQPLIEILDTTIIDMGNLILGEIYITPSGDTSTYQYFWSTGDTTQNLMNIQSPGYYYLSITDAAGCQDTFSFEVGYVNTNFVLNHQRINVRLYPNPIRSNQLINIEFDAILDDNINYQLVNIDGKILSNGNLPKQKLQHQIKTPEQAGMYYFQLILDNQMVKVIPFLVE